jgi:hypothetical protein
MMENRMGRPFLQFPEVRQNLQNDPPFVLELARYESGIHFFRVSNPRQNILAGRLADVQMTTFSW